MEETTRVVDSSFLLLPRQLSLLPLRTLIEFPDTTGTADAWGKVVAEDSHYYVVKGTRGGNRVPASEWIGSHIAEAVHLPCPTPKIIQLENGSLVFGSRIVDGIADKTETAAILTSITVDPARKPIPGLCALLSAIYALDMFTNNVDRHRENYLSIEEHGGRKFYLIDMGRSLFWNDLSTFPESNQNTRVTGREIRRCHGVDLEAAERILDRIAQLAPERIMSFMATMPEEWMPEHERRAFINWWSSDARSARARALRQGLKDGSLL